MSLAWHIAKKDIRRMALPTSLWLVYILGASLWFLTSPRPEQWDPMGLLNAVALWSRMLVTMQFVVGIILVAATVLEDPLVGTNQFWPTRPIPNTRLLAAKVLSVGILFIAGPTLVLVPAWLASGFSLVQILAAGAEIIFWQAIAALASAMVAVVTPDLARFVGAVAGLLVLGIAALTISPFVFNLPAAQSRPAMSSLPWIGAGLMMSAAVLQQFITRRSALTWTLIGLVCGLVVSMRLGWGPKPGLSAIGIRDRVAREGREFKPDKVSIQAPPKKLRLVAEIAASPDGMVPLGGVGWVQWTDGTRQSVDFGDTPRSIAVQLALRQVMGRPSTTGWSLPSDPLTIPSSSSGEPRLDGPIKAWPVRVRVLEPIPIRTGAEQASGAMQTRIVSIDDTTGWRAQLIVEERDSQLALTDGWKPWARNALGRSERKHDRYVLVNRVTGQAQAIPFNERNDSQEELGSVNMHSMLIGYRRLLVPLEQDPETWQRDSVLVKVRFEHPLMGALARGPNP